MELRPGIGLKIDDKNMGRLEYRRCLGDNCVAEAVLKEDILQHFLKGKMATYFILQHLSKQLEGSLISMVLVMLMQPYQHK